MQKISKWLGVKAYSVKESCIIAMLLSLTVLLSLTTTFYPAPWLKITFKFVSVFVTGVLFGPIIAGGTSFIGDALCVVFRPSLTFIPQISFVEFLAGFIYGATFHKTEKFSKAYVVRLVICVILQLILDIFVTTYFLSQVGYAPQNYGAAIISRLPASFIKLLLQVIVILSFSKYLSVFSKFLKK